MMQLFIVGLAETKAIGLDFNDHKDGNEEIGSGSLSG